VAFWMRIGALESRPAFVEFVQRHIGRPAAQRANARDTALAAEHPPLSA